jgi:hypothetical protein
MNNNGFDYGDKCELPTDHPMYNILSPMWSQLKAMSERARTPKAIAQKLQRKREILRSQGLLFDE